jgi:hypothetical protein
MVDDNASELADNRNLNDQDKHGSLATRIGPKPPRQSPRVADPRTSETLTVSSGSSISIKLGSSVIVSDSTALNAYVLNVGVVEGDGIPPARREATLVWAPTCERGEDGLKVNVEAEGRDGIVGEVLVPKVKPKIKVQFDVEEKDPIRGPIPIVESSSPLTDY